MCKVKSGNLIQTKQDVQNLIIGIINRQEKTYNKKKILELTEYYMQGSNVIMSSRDLIKLISTYLDMLYRNNRVCCKNGQYIPKLEFSTSSMSSITKVPTRRIYDN